MSAASPPTRYQLIGADGRSYGIYPSATAAGEAAALLWPHQEQDEDRTGRGLQATKKGPPPR